MHKHCDVRHTHAHTPTLSVRSTKKQEVGWWPISTRAFTLLGVTDVTGRSGNIRHGLIRKQRSPTSALQDITDDGSIHVNICLEGEKKRVLRAQWRLAVFYKWRTFSSVKFWCKSVKSKCKIWCKLRVLQSHFRSSRWYVRFDNANRMFVFFSYYWLRSQIKCHCCSDFFLWSLHSFL